MSFHRCDSSPTLAAALVALACSGCPGSAPSTPAAPEPSAAAAASPPRPASPPPAPSPWPVRGFVSFGAAESRCEEASGRASIELVLALEGGERLTDELRVPLVATCGGAPLGADLRLEPEEVAFGAGSAAGARARVELVITDDRRPERDVEVALELRPPPGASVGEPARHRLTVTDDDPLIITTIAGGDQTRYEPEGRMREVVRIGACRALALAGDGTIYFTDARRPRAVAPDGTVRTLPLLKRYPSSSKLLPWGNYRSAEGLALTPTGDALLVADRVNSCVVRVELGSCVVTIVAGDGGALQGAADDQPRMGAIGEPRALAFGPEGTLYMIEARSNQILELDLAGGTRRVVAGGGAPDALGDGGPATSAYLRGPEALCVGRDGAIFISEASGHRIRRVDADGVISTVAGTGSSGAAGDGGPAVEAQLHSPHGLAIDGSGNLFIADTNNHSVRRIDASTGRITTVAGTGSPGLSGDGGPATSAQLQFPEGVTVSEDGLTLFVTDTRNKRIRRIGPPE